MIVDSSLVMSDKSAESSTRLEILKLYRILNCLVIDNSGLARVLEQRLYRPNCDFTLKLNKKLELLEMQENSKFYDRIHLPMCIIYNPELSSCPLHAYSTGM